MNGGYHAERESPRRGVGPATAPGRHPCGENGEDARDLEGPVGTQPLYARRAAAAAKKMRAAERERSLLPHIASRYQAPSLGHGVTTSADGDGDDATPYSSMDSSLSAPVRKGTCAGLLFCATMLTSLLMLLRSDGFATDLQESTSFTSAPGWTASIYGPGPGDWLYEDDAQARGPEALGFATAARHIAAALPHRFCFLVVRDGELIHESYPDARHTAQSMHRTQSLGKTIIASLFGVAVQQGLLDIDVPLWRYGVQTNLELWNRTGINYWPLVTTRHLLSMSSGFGRAPPGTVFTYDSEEYTQHLSFLLEAITGGEAPIAWATRNYAIPLGVPELFLYDGLVYDIGGNISAGGGQMVSCRDVARVGALIVQRGVWRNAQGEAYQMMPEWYTSCSHLLMGTDCH